MRPHGTQKQLERRRRRAIELLKSGLKGPAVAKKLKCSASSVHAWQKQYQEQGEEGLKSKVVRGRPRKLNERQRKKLVEILLQGALKNGYSTELWTTRRIGEVINRRLKVEYHPKHVWRVLIGLGWSCQKPEDRAREKDERAVHRWKRYQWPHIKKRSEKKSSHRVS